MWDAYIQADGLLRVGKIKGKTVKRPFDRELANLQVRTLLSKSSLVPACTHILYMRV